MYAATKSPTCLRVLSERTSVDDGIRRIGIHVSIGKEIPMHSDGPRFQGGDAPKGFGIFRFAGRSKGHRMGKNRGAIQAHDTPRSKSAATIRGSLDDLCSRLSNSAATSGWLLSRTRAIHRNAHDQRSDVIFADVVAQLNPDGVRVIQELRVHPDAEELADFFFGRHLAQRLVGPLLCRLCRMDGTGLQKTVFALVFREAERRG